MKCKIAIPVAPDVNCSRLLNHSRAAAASTATMTPADDQDFVDAPPVASAMAGAVNVADASLELTSASAVDAGAVAKSEYFGDWGPALDEGAYEVELPDQEEVLE